MYKTLIQYNDHNNSPSFNESIWEAIRKVIEEELDVNNITVDTISHTSNVESRSESVHKKNKQKDGIDETNNE